MHLNSLHAVIEADVQFTRLDIHQLMDLSKHHYDGKCKAAGQHGGFLYGLDKMLDCNAYVDVVDVVVTWPQLDLLCKIAEGENGYEMVGGMPVPGELGIKILSIMQKMLNHSVLVNK